MKHQNLFIPPMTNLLFICSQNKLRSPTAEIVFNEYENINALSAGLNKGAEELVCPDLIEWADIILVMEKKHKTKLVREFPKRLSNKKIVCLDIPDEFQFMEASLIEILKDRVKQRIAINPA